MTLFGCFLKILRFDVTFFEVASGGLSFDFPQNMFEFVIVLSQILGPFGQSTRLIPFQNVWIRQVINLIGMDFKVLVFFLPSMIQSIQVVSTDFLN